MSEVSLMQLFARMLLITQELWCATELPYQIIVSKWEEGQSTRSGSVWR